MVPLLPLPYIGWVWSLVHSNVFEPWGGFVGYVFACAITATIAALIQYYTLGPEYWDESPGDDDDDDHESDDNDDDSADWFSEFDGSDELELDDNESDDEMPQVRANLMRYYGAPRSDEE